MGVGDCFSAFFVFEFGVMVRREYDNCHIESLWLLCVVDIGGK